MSKVYDYFKKLGMEPTPDLANEYAIEFGGTVIKTFRDEIFTDETDITMDTEKTIVLERPMCNFDFPLKVEINPNFIVSITYYEPKSKIVLAH